MNPEDARRLARETVFQCREKYVEATSAGQATYHVPGGACIPCIAAAFRAEGATPASGEANARPPLEAPRELEWRVSLVCCGRDAGAVDFETWELANAFRVSYTSGVAVAEHGYSSAPGEDGHQRVGIITRRIAARSALTTTEGTLAAKLDALCAAWDAFDEELIEQRAPGQNPRADYDTFHFRESPGAWAAYHAIDRLVADWQHRERAASPERSDASEGPR